jgi:two-component system LytT family response regulator
VDDEPIMRRSILQFLKAHPAVQVHAECGDGPSAVKSIKQYAPDFVFLDMQIPGFNGLEVVSKIGLEHMPLTVFVAAHGEYAVQAFEARAVDYLVKPFGQERFDEALRRVIERLPVAATPPTSPEARHLRAPYQDSYLEWIPVSLGRRVRPLKVRDVDWMEAEKNHVILHIGNQTAVVRRTLNSLEQSLNPKRFVRIHRSTIVNAERIREIHPWLNGYHMVVLHTGEQLRMSRYQQRSARILLGRCK